MDEIDAVHIPALFVRVLVLVHALVPARARGRLLPYADEEVRTLTPVTVIRTEGDLTAEEEGEGAQVVIITDLALARARGHHYPGATSTERLPQEGARQAIPVEATIAAGPGATLSVPVALVPVPCPGVDLVLCPTRVARDIRRVGAGPDPGHRAGVEGAKARLAIVAMISVTAAPGLPVPEQLGLYFAVHIILLVTMRTQKIYLLSKKSKHV